MTWRPTPSEQALIQVVCRQLSERALRAKLLRLLLLPSLPSPQNSLLRMTHLFFVIVFTYRHRDRTSRRRSRSSSDVCSEPKAVTLAPASHHLDLDMWQAIMLRASDWATLLALRLTCRDLHHLLSNSTVLLSCVTQLGLPLALSRVAGLGDIHVLRSLLDDDRVCVSSDVLTRACLGGHTESVRRLLGSARLEVSPAPRLNPDDPELCGGCAMAVACRFGHTDIVRLLLSDRRIEHSADALVFACSFGHAETVDVLLGSRTICEHVAVIFAAACRAVNVDVMQLLFDNPRARQLVTMAIQTYAALHPV
jgi:hypothetical protein